MERRPQIGMLFVAGVVALGAIGTAYATVRYESKAKPATVTVTEAPRSSSNWQEELLAVNPASGADEYTPAPSLSPTDALARKLFVEYAGAHSGGSLDMSKLNDALAKAAAEAVPPTSPKTYALKDLRIEHDVSLAAYQGALASAFKSASAVREYEPATFARAINERNDTDLAKLRSAGMIYGGIRDRLASMQVPADVAEEHLAVVNAVSALGAADLALGGWGGDPLAALTAVNAYVAAEGEARDSMNTLYALIRALEKKS